MAVLEEGLRHSRRPFVWLLVAISVLAVLMVGGFLLLATKSSASVQVTLALDGMDLKDGSLTYFLDDRPITAAELEHPVELSIGEHTLLVYRKCHIILKSQSGEKSPHSKSKSDDGHFALDKHRPMSENNPHPPV